VSGQQARVWPVDDGYWHGEIVVSAAGIRFDLSHRGRPYVPGLVDSLLGRVGDREYTKKYTVDELEKLIGQIDSTVVILREVLAVAKELGGSK
jgi:hypothetical protein